MAVLPAESEVIYLAYFPPYDHACLDQLLGQYYDVCSVKHEVIGQSRQSRPIPLVTLGTPSPDSVNIWCTAGQHPGETMGYWFIDGLLREALKNPATYDDLVFFIVPNINPDGSALGNHRTDSTGNNLNRQWSSPGVCPEVDCVKRAMQDIGVDFYLDVHGDESLPYVFLSGADGVASLSQSTRRLGEKFIETLLGSSDDFQTQYGYPKAGIGSANMAVAKNWVADSFNCPAFTLEMPFKDNRINPQYRWTPQRCQTFAADCFHALTITLNGSDSTANLSD